MGKQVLYWRGVLGDPLLLEEYKIAIEKLLQGQYSALKLEKLHGHRLYSIRINKSTRLLFTTATIDDQPYILLLEEILNHDYQGSHFLSDPSRVQKYLEKNATALTESVNAGLFSQISQDQELLKTVSSESIESYQTKAMEYYHYQFVSLDEAQEEAARTMLPFFLTGISGTGKSFLALRVFSQFLMNWYFPDKPRLLYVTTSPKLVQHMKEQWVAQGMPADAVDFFTYKQLLTNLGYRMDKECVVGKKKFYIWLNSYIKKYSVLQKTGVILEGDRVSSEFLLKTDLIYQEFRLLSGYSAKHYIKKTGKRESNFSNLAERHWLVTAYATYLDNLQAERLIHPAFHQIEIKNAIKYCRIVVDESQDFSRNQLRQLMALAHDKQICYLTDSLQRLYDIKSVHDFLQALTNKKPIHLKKAYRCPAEIMKAAGATIDLRNLLTGGISNDQERMKIILSDCQRKNPGQVFWLTSQSNEAINTLQQPNNLTINFAIVTHKCFIEEARILFNNHAHIYTFKEIKGLQFKRVLAYRVFDHAIFRLASALLGKNKGSTHFIHRPKEGVGDAGFYPWFHLIFMAFTRAMATLFIYHHDDEDRELKYLLQPLKDIILNEKTKEASIPTDSRPSTSKEWLAEYEKLKQFNPEQAAVILNQQTAKFDFAKIAEKQTKAQETLKKGKAKKKQTRRKKEPTLPVLPEKESVSIPDKIELKLLKTFLRRCSVSALKKIVLHKNAANMLFSHEFCHRDGTNKMLLIDFICVNSKAFNAFRQFVESQEYQSRMFDLLEEALSWPLSRVSSMDLPIPPIYWLVRTYSLMLILKKLFENRPGLVKKIDPHTIGWMDKRTTEFEKDLSALYYLSSLPISQSILAQVVMHDPLLASQSMATALMHSLHEKNGIRKNTSPFYLLSRSIPGQTLLRIFLENVPSIAPRVFKLLFLTCNVKEAKCPVSFPLSEMARTDEGIAFLLKLLELYPQFAQEIRTEQLCLMFTVAAGKKKYAPPLYYLSKKAAGIDFLDKLFCLNSTLVNPTFMKTLCRTRHELIGEGKHISGLEFMCRTAGGPQFLNKILTQHRHLALYFSSDFLYKHHELGSLFFKFTSDPIGLDILTRLFVDNADLLIQFPSAALCQSVYISGVGEINSLLYLSSTPTGRSLLYYMLANRPDLLKEITGVALCLPLTKEAGSNENKSALYYLSQDSLGISIISKILQANSDFITQISPKALCRQLPEAAGKCQNAFALHHLFRNQTDAPLVFIFLEKIAALENHMTAALLCQVLDDFGDDVVNASLIYYLSMSVPGLKFLLRLLESHPEVAVGITAADLCRPFSQILNLYDNTNVIYFLTLTPLGCSVFSKLLDLNPDLAKQMTAQGLCHLRPENAGPYQNCSVLSNFSATPEGQHLYERILQDNPGLPAEIVLNKDAMATIKSFPYVAQLPGLKIMENLLWFQQGLESTFYREEPIDYPLSESMEILASTSFLFFPPQRIHKQKAQSECSEVKSVNACN